jgi:hypothetical protein
MYAVNREFDRPCFDTQLFLLQGAYNCKLAALEVKYTLNLPNKSCFSDALLHAVI